MAKKILRFEIVAEMEIDTEWYNNESDEKIIEIEKGNTDPTIMDHIISEKLTIRDK